MPKLESRQRRQHHRCPAPKMPRISNRCARDRGGSSSELDRERESSTTEKLGFVVAKKVSRALRCLVAARMNEGNCSPSRLWRTLGHRGTEAIAEDFQVDEVLESRLAAMVNTCGSGSKNVALNTKKPHGYRQAAGVPLRTVSYAGLKDRQALPVNGSACNCRQGRPGSVSGGKRHAEDPQDHPAQAQAATRCAFGQRFHTRRPNRRRQAAIEELCN